MERKDWNRLFSIAVITSILTCGLLAPLWLITLLIVKISNKPIPKNVPRQNPKVTELVTILPSNEFAGDWEFKMYEIETEV